MLFMQGCQLRYSHVLLLGELVVVVGGQDRDRGKSLLAHVRDDALGLTGATVVGGGALAEDLEGGVALDAVLLADSLLLGAVDLGELDVLTLEGGGGLLVVGSEAVTLVYMYASVQLQHTSCSGHTLNTVSMLTNEEGCWVV